MARSGKYNAKKITSDGFTFDSQAEARRYETLRLLSRAGHIRNLEVHPRFELQPAFRDQEGNKVKAIYWEADFSYWENDRPVVEDVKGVWTAVFRLKLKMFQFRYSQTEVRIIPAQEV